MYTNRLTPKKSFLQQKPFKIEGQRKKGVNKHEHFSHLHNDQKNLYNN